MSSDSSKSKTNGEEQRLNRVTDSLRDDAYSKFGASKVPWSPFWAILYAIVSFGLITQLIVPVALYGLLLIGGRTSIQATALVENSIPVQFVYVLCAEALTFGAVWWFVRRHGGRLRVIGWRRIRWTDPAVTLIAYAVYFISVAILFAVVKHVVPSFNTQQKQQLGFNHVSSAGNLILTFFRVYSTTLN